MTKFLKIDELIDTLTEYVKTKLELIKLNMVEELSEIIAQTIAVFLIFTVLMLFLIFGSITLGTFLNNLWQSAYLGYGAVTGVYLLILFFFVYLLRSGKLKEAVEEQISKNIKLREESLNERNHE